MRKVSLTVNHKHFMIACMFCLAFIFPISSRGKTLSDGVIVIEWSVLSLLLLYFAVVDGVSRSRLQIALLVFLYLLLATFTVLPGKQLRFSFARMAPVVCSLLLLSINHKVDPDRAFLKKIFDLFVCITIVINLLLLMKISFVSEFIIKYYTQFEARITRNFILTGRPIGLFGVGNIASFFYMTIFIVSAVLYEATYSSKYKLYMVTVALFCLLVRNTTSLGSVAIMTLYYFYVNYKKKSSVFTMVAIGVAAILFLGSSIYTAYQESLQQKANGLFPRYFSGDSSIFKQNFAMLKEYILGIGYTMDKSKMYNILFADSGYIVNFTMGNVVYPIGLYYLFYIYLKYNVVSNRFRKLIFTYVMTMELGFITFLSLRTVCLIHIMTIYAKAFGKRQ